MKDLQTPAVYSITSLPEYKRLMMANNGDLLQAKQIAVMYSKAIDWFAILGTIWPDFSDKKYQSIEVAYLFAYDPDEGEYTEDLYKQIASMIAMFWKIRLENLYPGKNWRVEIRDDPEITVEAEIFTAE